VNLDNGFVGGMKTQKIERLQAKLQAFLMDVVVPFSRKERRGHVEEYLQGLRMESGNPTSSWPDACRVGMFKLWSRL
jgi:hypothetical protein